MRIELIILFIILSVSLFAQDAASKDFWVTSVLEANFFSVSNTAFGGGAAIGYGDGTAIGLKLVFFSDVDEVKTLELDFLLRFYLPRLTGHSGLFVQFNGGPVIFAFTNDDFVTPSKMGAISAGLSVGWRFLFGQYFYLEPAVRVGYPYVVGAGLSAGMRF